MNRKEMEIREALKVAETVLNAFQQAARLGATEQDLHCAVLTAAGGHEVQFDLLTGARTADVEGGATERALQAGDPLLLDLCLKQGEHWCDICRTYFLGEPTQAIRQTYEKVLDCFALVKGLLRPGVEASLLYLAAEKFFSQNGMDGFMRHHTGHGIGLTPFEAPVETPTSQDVLSAGDVVTVEIGVYQAGEYGIRVEDDYLVSTHGITPLWDYPKTLQSSILLKPTTIEEQES